MPDDLGPQIRDYIDAISSPVSLDDVTSPRRSRRPKRRALALATAVVVIAVAAVSILVVNRREPQRVVVAPLYTYEQLDATTLDVPQLVSPSTVLESDTSIYTLRSTEQRVTLIARYDVPGERLAASISLGGAEDFALTSDALFVLRDAPISNDGSVAGSAAVDVLSPDTLRVERTFPVATQSPLRVAVAGDAVWVMGFDGVKRYNAATGVLLGAVSLRAERCPAGVGASCLPLTFATPYDMEADPATDRVFVAWEVAPDLGVTEFDSKATPVSAGFPLGRSRVNAMSATRSLAVGDGSLFFESDGANPLEWNVFSSANLAAPATATIRGSSRLALQSSGGKVWAIDEYRASISCLDPTSGRKLWETTKVDHPESVAVIGDELFVFSAANVERAPLPAACRD